MWKGVAYNKECTFYSAYAIFRLGNTQEHTVVDLSRCYKKRGLPTKDGVRSVVPPSRPDLI